MYAKHLLSAAETFRLVSTHQFLVTLFRVGFVSIALLVLDYRWSYNPPTYSRTIPTTGIGPTPVQNSASKIAGLQIHAPLYPTELGAR